MTHPDQVALTSDALLDKAEVADWTGRVRAAFEGSDAPGIAELFEQCLRRTLDRSLRALDDGGVAVITGDIPAMWLRDSSTQMWPYLTFAAADRHGPIADLLGAVSKRQLSLIAHDPYANAFNVRADGSAHAPDDDWGDHPSDPLIWERKYEVDSLCFPIQLLSRLLQVTGRADLVSPDLPVAARKILDVLSRERQHMERSDYVFRRDGSTSLDTLSHDGRGAPLGFTGMTWSGFRPSDDSCTYGYNIPANLLAVSALRDMADLCGWDESIRADAKELADDLGAAVARHGVVDVPSFGKIWAYEVNGLGDSLLMDDANLPSLLSLPLLADVRREDPLYQRTRRFVLSDANPFYYSGSVLRGIGSPHTPEGWVWPIAIATRGLTADSREEALRCAEMIATTTAGTNHIHEGIDCNDQDRYSRSWFSWADSMFCLLVMHVADGNNLVYPGGF